MVAFTSAKYHINTIAFIKSCPIKNVKPVSNFPWLASLLNLLILQKEALLDLWSIQGVVRRNQRQKLEIFRQEKKGEKNTNG